MVENGRELIDAYDEARLAGLAGSLGDEAEKELSIKHTDRYEEIMKMIRPEWGKMSKEQMAYYYIWLKSEMKGLSEERAKRKREEKKGS